MVGDVFDRAIPTADARPMRVVGLHLVASFEESFVPIAFDSDEVEVA